MLELLSQPVYIGGTFGGENLQLWLVMILWQGFMLLVISQLVDIDSPMNRVVIISKALA